MPFIRQTRDKRGFEQTLVMHAYHPPGGGPSRPRVLYLFRTPANLRVGRQPLDAEVMEALEHTHPDLSFDWNAVVREVSRVEPTEPPRRPGRPDRPRRARPDTPSAAPAAPNDPSPLGRTIGATEAVRLRQRYQELLQRIERRAPTPEDRSRLLDRAERLNPDGWPDEATIRAEIGAIDAAWREIANELPSRRRGRRGGRRPEGGVAPSAIMSEDSAHAEVIHEQVGKLPPSDAGRDVGRTGDGNSGGSDAAAAAQRPGDSSID